LTSPLDRPPPPLCRKRILSGFITGGVGQAVASPTDVVKVRLQADGRLKLLGGTPRYKGTLDAFVRIPKEEGFKGFFRGLGPSVQRAAVINGCGIASYDHTKQVVLRLTGKTEGLVPQVAGSLVSGLISALVSTPFDVVKTRIMNQPVGTKLYSGPIDCAMKTVRAEGPLALYKGFVPAYTRLGPWQLVFFLTFEQVNKLGSISQL
jgi:solute carrier family 25 (mitochondrial uncoupling protein), member 27